MGPISNFFPDLTALDLDYNGFSGAVPTDVGAGAGRMRYLSLAGNGLRGVPGALRGKGQALAACMTYCGWVSCMRSRAAAVCFCSV